MKKEIRSELLKYNPNFTETELDLGLELFEEKQFKANEIVCQAGQICDTLIFAQSSITRCFNIDSNGNEMTLWMKPEKKFLTEFKSFVHRDKSQFSLQFYEDTTAFLISRENLLKLYQENLAWANFGVSLTEQLHITLIDVFVNLLANDATRNYQYIEYMFPRFIQVAPLKDIASMLQISQVSLSRIRSGNQLKN